MHCDYPYLQKSSRIHRFSSEAEDHEEAQFSSRSLADAYFSTRVIALEGVLCWKASLDVDPCLVRVREVHRSILGLGKGSGMLDNRFNASIELTGA